MAAKALGYEQVTGLDSVKTLTVPTGAKACLLQAEAQNVRFRDDGTNPSSSVGMILVAAAAPFLYQFGSLSALKFIEVTGTAKLNVTYFK